MSETAVRLYSRTIVGHQAFDRVDDIDPRFNPRPPRSLAVGTAGRPRSGGRGRRDPASWGDATPARSSTQRRESNPRLRFWRPLGDHSITLMQSHQVNRLEVWWGVRDSNSLSREAPRLQRGTFPWGMMIVKKFGGRWRSRTPDLAVPSGFRDQLPSNTAAPSEWRKGRESNSRCLTAGYTLATCRITALPPFRGGISRSTT